MDDGAPIEIPARDNLAQIIAGRTLRAFTPMRFATDQDDPADAAKQSQRTVCFTETPLEHTWAMFEHIEDRINAASS
jgi:hypothetical protein